jgi:23S rRNA (cytidine1920-2'-O)/16S rRNA (cytidine1409-2'-O)-methyltransferase
LTTPRARLDAELVRRGLARSREQAGELIAAGRVAVAGQRAAKSATQVARDAPITVQDTGDPGYVSRGGYKLAGALAVFAGRPQGSPPGSGAQGGPGGRGGDGGDGQSPPCGGSPGGGAPGGERAPGNQRRLVVAGRQCLDAGASTGGFTDVLLRAGAAHVVAADVGYGQLAWSLRTDPRVTVMDRVNVRTIGPLTPAPDLVVADLSFISLTLVLPALVACATPDADFVLLVKPQFEVGRDRVGAGGVVREATDRSAAVEKVSGAAAQLGLGVQGITASPLPGPAGNVEYFLWLRRGAPPLDPAQLRRVVAGSPGCPGAQGGERGDGQSPLCGGSPGGGVPGEDREGPG